MKYDKEIFLKTNKNGKQELLLSDVINSALGHFTGVRQSHIYSHKLEKVVCGSNSFWCGGLNHDLNIEILKDVGIEQAVSCKRCQKWFKKHYL